MPRGCCNHFWERIPEDEPVFTLAARDKLAVGTIKKWIELAQRRGVSQFKIDVATAHLEDFQRFATEHPERMKLPD